MLPQLKYQVKISAETVQIQIELSRLPADEKQTIWLYTGNINLKNVYAQAANSSARITTQQQGKFLIITPLTQIKMTQIELQYEVGLGSLAKHGHQGFLSTKFCVFGGEQIFIIPASAQAHKIEVSFELPATWQSFLPFQEANLKNKAASEFTITDSSWTGIYQLMKNCYAFGELEFLPAGEYTSNLHFCFLKHKIKTEFRRRLVNGSSQIIHFFENHFKHKIQDYSLLFLPQSAEKEQIMGGIGPLSAGFTMHPDKLRDWQLLAHRLFHVFFDRRIHFKKLHAPPFLWILEGLAGYYEIQAAAAAKSGFSTNTHYSTDEEWARLYRRYLYFRIKDPELFGFAPAAEEKLTHKGQTEFLHYTQAPLTIFALEKLIAAQSELSVSDQVWNRLTQIDEANLEDFKQNFADFGGISLDTFFQKYVEDQQILDLRQEIQHAADKENQAEIIRQLQDYEYLLWTWFQGSPQLFLQHSISAQNFEALANLADQEKIHFATPDIENLVNQFSPTVHGLLKIHFLCLKKCGVEPADPGRNFKLSLPENRTRWESIWKEFSEIPVVE